ncbi:MAG TPA: SRPBCC family protein [Armatimonadota bacterium]|nr:SRPBCC family protein [Armatimonadota bacterium]
MPEIIVETEINAPAQRCFNAARDIGLHCKTLAHTGERAVAGVTTGLIGPGESVTFEGIHFGVRQQFTARVTAFEAPGYFVDETTEGAFHSMRHCHEFIPRGQGTLMRDIVQWKSPMGVLGIIADSLSLKRYMRNLITKRGQQLKHLIEAE